jgi:DNA-binding transcriptional ArsR family regulator
VKDYDSYQEQYETLSEKLKAIAHPIRLQILNILMERGSQNVTQLYEALEMPQSTVSQHLAKLKAFNVVYGNRKGLEIYYDIVDDSARQIIQILNRR